MGKNADLDHLPGRQLPLRPVRGNWSKEANAPANLLRKKKPRKHQIYFAKLGAKMSPGNVKTSPRRRWKQRCRRLRDSTKLACAAGTSTNINPPPPLCPLDGQGNRPAYLIAEQHTHRAAGCATMADIKRRFELLRRAGDICAYK
jgi:hypothetical protein